jgi:hypothetical protein
MIHSDIFKHILSRDPFSMIPGFNRQAQPRHIWQKPRRGVLNPKPFIGIALILPITLSILFCTVKRQLYFLGKYPCNIPLRFSMLSFPQPWQCLRKYDLDPFDPLQPNSHKILLNFTRYLIVSRKIPTGNGPFW